MSGGYHISQKHLLCTQQCTSHQDKRKEKNDVGKRREVGWKKGEQYGR